MVEYASITAAISIFVSALGNVAGSALPASTAKALPAVVTIAQSHKVSAPAAKVAYRKAPFGRPALRYLYAAGWVGATSNLGACKLAQLPGADPATAATQALQSSPKALSVLKASHVTVKQAATALGEGTIAGCQ